jgi:hypothetical protein
MQPTIESTQFGSITINGQVFEHDVLITAKGQVKKRKKKLSKQQYGTSHIISLAEAKYVYEQSAHIQQLIIGSGQMDNVRLSEEAESYFTQHHCQVELQPTPRAIRTWNDAQEATTALFHVTC